MGSYTQFRLLFNETETQIKNENFEEEN